MLYSIQQFIAALKQARLTKKLSQSELATKLGIPQSHISKIESGNVNPRLTSFIELARMLDLEIMLVPRQKVLLIKNILAAKKPGEGDIEPAYIPDKEDQND